MRKRILLLGLGAFFVGSGLFAADVPERRGARDPRDPRYPSVTISSVENRSEISLIIANWDGIPMCGGIRAGARLDRASLDPLNISFIFRGVRGTRTLIRDMVFTESLILLHDRSRTEIPVPPTSMLGSYHLIIHSPDRFELVSLGLEVREAPRMTPRRADRGRFGMAPREAAEDSELAEAIRRSLAEMPAAPAAAPAPAPRVVPGAVGLGAFPGDPGAPVARSATPPPPYVP